MGGLAARDMAGQTDLRTALSWHLTSNHYPPVPTSMVPICEQAIQAIVEEDYDREITLPAGVSWLGKDSAPARAIAEAHHLHSFIEAAMEEIAEYGEEEI